MLAIFNLSDASPVDPAGLHANQTFGVLENINEFNVGAIFEQLDATNYPARFVEFINNSLEKQTISPIQKITDGMKIGGSQLSQSSRLQR